MGGQQVCFLSLGRPTLTGGNLQAYYWPVMYPDFVEKCVD